MEVVILISPELVAVAMTAVPAVRLTAIVRLEVLLYVAPLKGSETW